jgi:hypothetical protein
MLWTIVASLGLGIPLGFILANAKLPFKAEGRKIGRAAVIIYGAITIVVMFHNTSFVEGMMSVCMTSKQKSLCFWIDTNAFIAWTIGVCLMVAYVFYLKSLKTLFLKISGALCIVAIFVVGMYIYNHDRLSLEDNEAMQKGFGECTKSLDDLQHGPALIELKINQDKVVYAASIIDNNQQSQKNYPYQTEAAGQRIEPNRRPYTEVENRIISAYTNCSPLTFLPDGKYEIWKHLQLELKP